MRAMMPVLDSPSVTAGSTRCARVPCPATGNHPCSTEKKRMASSANQKVGIDTPTSASTMASASTQVLDLSADTMPRPTPTSSAKTMEAAASSTVLGK